MRENKRAYAHRGRLAAESTPAKHRVASRRPASGAHRLRPALVQLENRQLLATFQVTSPADTFNSNGTPTTGTLRWAVEQANSASTPSTITFNLAPGSDILFSKQSDPLVLTNTAEPTTITGSGASELTVSANKSLGGGVFQIAANVTATISGLTITGGFTYYASVDDLGSLTLTGCTVTDNIGVGHAGAGGKITPGAGLYIKGSATVSGCTFSDNNGTGLYNAGTANISDCTITGNSALGPGGGLSSGGTTTLTDCTITSNWGELGSGIYDKGNLTVTGCTITGNGTATDGGNGGGVCEAGTGTVSDSTISGNYAPGYGGNLYNEGALTVNNCTITGANTREEEPTALGGCVFNKTGTAAFTNCTITGGNVGLSGGDVYNAGGATLDLTECMVTDGRAGANGGGISSGGIATLTDCTVSGNVVGDWGGGIANGPVAPDLASILTVVDSTISANSSGLGGGGVFNDGTATLTNCTIANNDGNTSGHTFLYQGGGGLNNAGDATLVACTVTGNNNSMEGGGGLYDNGSPPGTQKLTLNDTIVAGNTVTTPSGTSPSDIATAYSSVVESHAVVAGSYNLIGIYQFNDNGDTGSLVGSHNIVLGSMSDPPALGLAPLGDYGGPTETMALLPGSLAIGTGSQALELDADGNALTGDQRGFAFDSPNPDIGAYQDVSSRLVVSVATDGVGAPPGELDLRAAVNLDNLQASATAITFKATAFATAQAINLVDGQLELSNTAGTIAINGPAAGVTVGGDQVSRVFQVDKNVTATISGLTIAEGLSSTATGGSYAGYGGGLLNLGTATLIGCTVAANTATIAGGGLANAGRGASLTLTNSLVTDNQTGTSGAGGGIDNPFFDTVTVSSTMISSNSAGTGGGLVSLGMATLTNSTVTGNTATSFGGGVYDNDGTIDLSGCTISANTASSGAGLFIDGNGTLVACALFGNSSGGNLDNENTITLTNCTLANSAGFGLLNEFGTATLIACTVTGNQNQGLANYYSNGAGTIKLTDTIVVGNTSGNAAADIGGLAPQYVTGTYNLVGTGGSGGLVNDGTNVLDVSDPGLAALGDYGGSTLTVALLPGSPAIGAGTAVSGVTTDQRGLPLDSPAPDIGAFQSQGFTLEAVGATTVGVAPGASVVLAVTVSAKNPIEPVAGGVVTFGAGSSDGASATLTGTSATIGAALIDGTNYADAAVVTATANATAGTYTLSATAAGAATPVDFTLTNLIELSFSGAGLANQTITYGTSSVTISGTLASGANAPVGADVQVTLVNGPTQTASIQTGGAFATTFANTASLSVADSPYTFDVTYAGDATFAPAGTTVTLSVTPAQPTISWQGPADISYGTALSSIQLDASANVDGTFSYSPALGTVFRAGAGQKLSVTFTPQDSTDYTTATGTATINVDQATPTINWTNPADITYGTSLSGTQLDATASWIVGGITVNVKGKFSYSQAAGTVLTAGAGQSLSVSFTPNDTTDFTTGRGTATINVDQATPTINWSNPADITYGTSLSSTQLDATASWIVGGTAVSVNGELTYTQAAGTVLTAGAGQTLSVSFTPDDTTDFTPARGASTINVDKATPTITWPSPSDIGFGTALSGTQLDASTSWIVGGVTTTVAGTPTYTPAPGTVLPEGDGQTLSISFVPADTTDYATATATALINVNKLAPIITWADPMDITYGTALSTTQLNATANVAGIFQYTPAPGTKLPAGTDQILSAVFTPADLTDYTTVDAQVTINVAKATPNLSVIEPGGAYDGNPFAASVTVTGSDVDNSSAGSLQGIRPTVTYYDGTGTSGTSLGSTAPSAPGTYTVVAAFPGDNDYQTAVSSPVVFTINQATANVALTSTGGSAVFGQGVTFVATVSATVGAAGTPTGTVTFLDSGSPLGTVTLGGSGNATFNTSSLSPGSHAITAVYNGSAFFLSAGSAATSESVSRGATAPAMLVAQPIFKKKKVVSFGLTAAIEPSAPGGSAPTGTVAFELVTKKRKKTITKLLGTVRLSGGDALLTVPAKSVLGQTITIVYNGDGDFLGSTVVYPKLTSKGR
jgi:Bacterial Ig-like domain (group 3)/Right handed beta helix region